MTAPDGTVHEAGAGCWAYVQRDGSWGWSNAGLVVGDGRSLLVDTLFDLDLTAAMLEAFAGHTTTAPIGTVVNTHANGDHCYGNELLAGAAIVASTAAAAEMAETPPALLASLVGAPGEVGDLFRSFFGEFHFDDISLTLPTRVFDGRLTLDVAGRAVELIEVGPAHTRGDVLAYVPDCKTIFTGDILFIDGTPIVWAGPLGNWIAACDLMLDMDVDVVVPGHGPPTDRAGITAVREYLAFVEHEATARHAAGLDAFEAATDIARSIGARPDFGTWGEAGRNAVNVETHYRSLDPTHRTPHIVEQFRRMAALDRRP